MSLNTIQYCARCGRAFRSGQTRYLVTIHLTADFDGTIESGAGNAPEQLWKEIEEKSEEELTNEVAQKLSFTLCKPCRDDWVRSPLGPTITEEGQAVGHLH